MDKLAGVDGEQLAAERAVCASAAVRLRNLVQHLAKVPEFQAQVEAITQIAQASPTRAQLLTLIDSLEQLLTEERQGQLRSQSQYLGVIDQELKWIHSLLTGAQAEQVSNQQARSALHGSMVEQLDAMALAAAAADELEPLKNRINQQLSDIRRTLEHYQSTDDAQLGLTQQLEQLTEKLQDMEQQAEAQRLSLEQQRYRATHDSLTQLPNREAYTERVAFEIERWQRYGHPLTLAVCDIDHFKRINDRFGHLAGDRVLKVVSRELAKRLRKVDFFARYGGEEFIVLMPETTLQNAWSVLENIRKAIAATEFHYRSEPLGITLSVGMAEFTGKDTAEEVFMRADRALYQAKANGRNQSQKA